MEDIELQTVIKEKIDRLTERLTMDEQKITSLELSLEKQKAELESIKAQKLELEKERDELAQKTAGKKTK